MARLLAFALVTLPVLALGDSEILRFEGKLRSAGKPCELRIVKVEYPQDSNDWKHVRVTVHAPLRHGKDEAGLFELVPDHTARKLEPERALISAHDPTVDRSIFRLELAQDRHLGSADRYLLRWWHINHFHNFVCEDLKRL